MSNKYILYIASLVLLTTFFSCQKEEVLDIASADERKQLAHDSLFNELIAPQFGWRVSYQPTPSLGSFLILMKFNSDGTVNIKSDISEDDGYFLDNDNTYRIDAGLGTELIFESYSVFSFLFEVAEGEFEFFYLGKQGDNIILQSKSDGSSPTRLTFEPAGEFDEQLLSNVISDGMKETLVQDPQLIGNSVFYQLYLIDKNISVFMTLDLDVRAVKILSAGIGETEQEINNNTTVDIFHKTTYAVQGNKIVFSNGFNFELNNQSILITEIELGNFTQFQQSFCDNQFIDAGKFDGNIGNENITFTSTLYTPTSNFVAINDGPYGVSSIGFFDGEDESMQEILAAAFPDIAAIQFYFNYTQIDPALNGVGFVTVDAQNNADFFIREFNPPTFKGNKMNLTFTGQSLITKDNSTAEEEQALVDLTNLLFSGDNVYILEFADDDELFEIYNPCNQHKLFLFK
ncbi:MAG: DUF4302 domain-containing protein [Cyclobacteriaceae bacterium]